TEPQILIIDEALAVGDALFQHRCLRRIKQMQENGATILFVSHDPAAVKALCSRAILLNAGRIDTDGKPSEVLNRYQGLIMEREQAYEAAEADEDGTRNVSEDLRALTARSSLLRYSYRHGDRSAELISAEVLNVSGGPADLIDSGEALLARLRVHFNRDIEDPVFGFLIRNRHGISAYGANTEQKGLGFGNVKAGEIVEVNFSFDCWLGSDNYSVSFAVHSAEGVSYDWLDGVHFFRVVSAPPVEGIANLNATVTSNRLGVLQPLERIASATH